MTDLRVQIADVIVRKILQEDYDDLVEGYLDEILMAADQIILLPAYKAVSQAYYDKLSSPVVPVGVSREDEAWSLAMGIPAFNDLPAQFQQDIHAAILAALGTTDQGSRSKVPTDGGQAAVGDGWIEWSGGENPVPGKMVCVRWDGGEDIKAWPSEKIAWGVDSNGSSYVISYRLAAPASPIPGGYEPKANEPDTDTGREG